jgi:hypothetical protein
MMKKIRLRNAAVLAAAFTVAAIVSCGDDSSTGTGPTGSIAGTVTFRNTFPATGNIFITVFSQYPPTGAPDAFTNPITEAMLSPTRTYDFTISGLETGTYKAVLIGWRGGVGNDKCMGLYWAFPDSVGIGADCVAQAPGPLAVAVNKDKTTTGVNMVADLSLAP